MMHKQMMPHIPSDVMIEPAWMNLQDATVSVTSEDPTRPVEQALLLDLAGRGGWRAQSAGIQAIKIVFQQPTHLTRIRLVFEEKDVSRTQQFVLSWIAEDGREAEIVRQQWNFSRDGCQQEAEDYRVALHGARGLELRITPDIGGGEKRASLEQLRLAS